MIDLNGSIKEKVIILCEGVTDIAFLSSLLQKQLNCEYVPKNIHSQKGLVSLNLKYSDEYAWYENDKYEFLVCSVGGRDKFYSFYKEHFFTKIYDLKYYEHLIIVTDRDCSVKDYYANIVDKFDLEFKENVWAQNNIKTWSEDIYNISTYLNIIPRGQEGSLETVLLQSMKNEEDIVECSCIFVDGLTEKESRFLIKKSDKTKAKLGVCFSLIDPKRTFASFSSRINNVRYDDNVIISNFSFIEKFK